MNASCPQVPNPAAWPARRTINRSKTGNMKTSINLLTGIAAVALTAQGLSAQGGLLMQRASADAAHGAIAQPVGFRIDSGSGGQTAPQRRAGNNSATVNAQGQDAFVRVTMPKHSLYV